MHEKWAHRSGLAKTAISDRHAARLWRLPASNLAVVSWPPVFKERVFINWHYWWQAHYIDCLVDAALRDPSNDNRQTIVRTLRGIRLRNGKFTRNRYYDDKAWLALALGRAVELPKFPAHRFQSALKDLELNIIAGIDSVTGVLPWRVGETFFNVPSNGPGAIMLARSGRLDQAVSITDWIFDNLINDDGLVMDGIRMRMDGPEIVRTIHPYNQGTAMAACLEVALELRKRAGFGYEEGVAGIDDAERIDESMRFITRIRELVQAVAVHMATPAGVIDWETGDGDGGLFKGILVRYLADVAVRLPADSPVNRAAKKLAARLVLASAESVWNHRLEVDGLPIFPTDWTADAHLPHNYGLGPTSFGEAVGVIRIAERDLSVQLSGWMLLEAAARVAKHRGEAAQK
ncbi:glycoside hydrolase family 76 protein [Corynebacterium uterequi]|uniref:Putative glycosyl hydrolase n=1 Tax=Corynebacterium uterequi TaxID=1072256 RepID=A0A0G3HJ02_9CORY|nr:glycoside hydrolase family 76 protein [Corynebacterium uterequi]AKK11928.1 putative glycosyl hydrolase [Corynebacterium uterequi]